MNNGPKTDIKRTHLTLKVKIQLHNFLAEQLEPAGEGLFRYKKPDWSDLKVANDFNRDHPEALPPVTMFHVRHMRDELFGSLLAWGEGGSNRGFGVFAGKLGRFEDAITERLTALEARIAKLEEALT